MLQLRLLLLVCFSTTLGQRRVLFGDKAQVEKYPFIVSIRLQKSSFLTCSGSIISKKHVLTAAHCFINYTSEAELVVGTDIFNEGGKHYKLELIVLHSMYSQQIVINDIALIKVKGIIEFNNVTQSICLRTSEVPPFSEVTIIGWGCAAFQIKQISVDYLMFATVLTMPQKYCIKYWSKMIPTSKICTFSFFVQGLCPGDSGGPLVYQGEQIGIASYGKDYADGLFNMFTNVSQFIVWINQAMAYLETNPDQFITLKPIDN